MAKKKITIEDLARMTQEGFKSSDQKIMTLASDLAEVKKDVKEMKENASELFAKIDEFISLYKKQEQEMIILSGQLKRLEERVAQLETKTKN